MGAERARREGGQKQNGDPGGAGSEFLPSEEVQPWTVEVVMSLQAHTCAFQILVANIEQSIHLQRACNWPVLSEDVSLASREWAAGQV